MKLLIAIPALNEEGAIESIIQRSLEARDHIVRNSPVTEVDITVVSDGSTDRTVELAGQYRDRINLIVFPKNRGYGAAIKEAWKASDADLVGFLDADGTCDPRFFADLCTELTAKDADVALGCRLNSRSQMPMIRRVGNFIFATLLSAFSSSRVRDTASGMRVVRRSSLNHLFPLPDGLHFTPAMSARAMLSDVLKIVEIDMSYHERVGESKLRVGKDGLRFLRVIVEAAFLYQPGRPLDLLAALLFIAGSLLMVSPAFYYLQNFRVLDWMIYRFLVASLAGTGACLFFCASVLARRMTRIALAEEAPSLTRPWTERFFNSKWFWTVPAGLIIVGSALILGSVIERLETGHTYEHWSRYVVASFAFSTAIILAVTRGIDFVLDLVEERVRYRKLIGATPLIHRETSPVTDAFVYQARARV
jgi:glycosyltransferase involved in cell wall biosynthesis